MANNPNLKEAQSKGGKVTGPRKRGYFMEQLEKHVFLSDKVFGEWVKDNYTDAIKELGKLQPKSDKLEIDSNITIIRKNYAD